MSRIGLRVALGCAGMALGLATPAQAVRDTGRYTSLTVFGDSLVDAGNIYTATGGAIPSPAQGYFAGRFTNGYDYTDYISLALFGTPTKASLRGGRNFAFGGARATTTSAVPDLQEQLVMFSLSGQAIDRNGLYVLNFGGNDIFNAPSDPAAASSFLRAAAQNYAGAVRSLSGQGARNILLTGFPVASSPYNALAESYLTEELGRLSLGSDVTLMRFDFAGFSAGVMFNPAAYGLPQQRYDRTCQQLGAAAIASGCIGIFSFDGTHPTAPIQRAAFQAMDRRFGLTAWQAVPEPASWMVMILGLGGVGAALRRRAAIHRAA